jgi:hypothetical protein
LFFSIVFSLIFQQVQVKTEAQTTDNDGSSGENNGNNAMRPATTEKPQPPKPEATETHARKPRFSFKKLFGTLKMLALG